MNDTEFTLLLTDMRETLYRVSYSRLATPSDRDDAVQETLAKAWAKRKTLRDERYAQTWVIRILINECNNILRQNKRDISREIMQERVAPIGLDTDIELHDTLFRLPDKQRTTIVLHYMEGFSTREIAQIMGVPLGTVLWRLSKARKELKKFFDMEVNENEKRIWQG
jgi:RNA polymerase sigma-70 factor (ECF subfamily)